jgi:CBS domain-containing protein
MTRGPVTITKEDTIPDAVKIMLDRKISGLPVVSGTSLVTGILTKTDIVKGIAEGKLP